MSDEVAKDEPTQEEVNALMQEMKESMQSEGEGGGGLQIGQKAGFRSEYSTKEKKYAGPHSVVTYEGPTITDPNGTGLDPKQLMHTNETEPTGKVLYANGSTYEGGFKLDMMHGYGVYKDPAGNIYQGEWAEDMREGKAVFASSYCRYEGEYKANKRHGQGKEVDGMGNTFIGEYKDGIAVHGKMNYANGDVYIGNFNDDERHGRGKFIDCEEGITLDGLWENDKYIGTAQG